MADKAFTCTVLLYPRALACDRLPVGLPAGGRVVGSKRYFYAVGEVIRILQSYE